MLAVIIKREILEYIKSAKFLIGLGITVTLLVISTLINIKDYKIRHQDYLDAQRDLTKDTFYVRVLRPPQMLSILAQGKDRKLGNSLTMTYLNLPYRTSGYLGQYASKHQQYAAGFAAVDFVFVVRVILSLMVIFLAYNAISEEKTQGTLKQVLANSLPRDQILLGKFAGGLFVVLGSLLISAVLTVLVLLFHPAISVAGTDWLRILSILGVSALYLICFYTLSLFVSVVVNRPSTALMILLQIWIFLIIILPNLGVIAANNFDRLPSEQEIAQQKTAAFYGTLSPRR
jgi:ABC-type transport system involved in multi-copper enzyme maturation permease subunit